MHVHLDFESRSPLDIKKAGGYAYAEHPDTAVLCLGVKVLESFEASIWVPAEFEHLIEESLGSDALRGLVIEADAISAHQGEVLQVRPKARDAKALRLSPDPDGGASMMLPRGFYLRASFTKEIVARYYRLPSPP